MSDRDATHGVAVIGVGALFPGATSAAQFWDNIAAGVDAIRVASDLRVDARYYDPGSSAPDRLYTRRGGFVGDTVDFDAGAFGIMPVAVPGAEPDQLLALQVAQDCLADAGLADGRLAGRTVGVILGRGGYLTPGMVRLERKARGGEELVGVLRSVLPELGEQDLAKVKAAFLDAAGIYGPDNAIGLVPNLAASRIANRLDLDGPAYTVDAACASSLIAVEHACRELRAGRCELVLAGGIQLVDDVAFGSVFAQLGALSRSGTIRPFDQRADGLLIGEGIGMVALKRLDHAERDGDRIYAVLWGVGSASDGRAASVMVPRVRGQVRALERAWRDAGMDPRTVGLIEAHGTATPAGDQAELATLREVFGDDGSEVALGSVKSMIGHAMPAAGVAGLIKAVLAVHHGVLPPSLNCEQPSDALAASRFRVRGEARGWDVDGERIAAVNAFGFGGINAHVVVGSHGAAVRARRRGSAPIDRFDVDIVAIAGADPVDVLARLERGLALRSGAPGSWQDGDGPCRLAVVDPTPERLDRARRIVGRGEPWTGRGGMWFRSRGLLTEGGELAFVFPGIEASFAPEIASIDAAPVSERFGAAPDVQVDGDLTRTGRAVVALGRYYDRGLRGLGLVPHAIAGHSIGEWTGMIASGIIPDGEVEQFLASIPFPEVEVPDVLFAAAGCGREVADEVIAGLDGIAVSHDNCPHQVILCGHDDPIGVARERLLARGVLCQVLPFRSGFHSPLFAGFVEPHRANVELLPLRPGHTPMWSATTAEPYPDDADAVRPLILEHLVAPIRFRDVIERLYADGVRVFVQAGAGSVPGFVADTLGDRPHLAVAASEERRPGLAQLRNLVLALYVEGAPVEPLVCAPRAASRVPIALGVRSIDVGLALPKVRAGTRAPGAGLGLDPADPLAKALAGATEALVRGAEDVVRSLGPRTGPPPVSSPATPQRAATPTVWSRRRTFSVHTDPSLRDHAFFPQPAGWPVDSDWRPVVPMTMSVQTMLESAEAAYPGFVAVELREVRAFRWLAVEPPVEVELRVEPSDAPAPPGERWVVAKVVDYAEARVRLAPRYAPAPKPALPPLVAPRPSPHSAAQMYSERWMFHGPGYQGVVGIGPVDGTGLDGQLLCLPAKGALLDAAGQLVGYWLLATHTEDQLTMPVGVDQIELFGPAPAAGARLGCSLRVVAVRARDLRCDLELRLDDGDGPLWCRMQGWVDHRFEADDAMVAMMRLPEHHALSDVHGDWVLFDDEARRTPSRDWLGRRYLGEAERDAVAAAGPRAQRQLLDDRVAIKDAVRALLRSEGQGPIFPVELALAAEPNGAYAVSGRGAEGVSVSVDHLDHRSVAIARRGGPVGIALAAGGTPVDALVRTVAAKVGASGADAEVRAVPGGFVVDGIAVAVGEVDGYLVGWTRLDDVAPVGEQEGR